MGYVNVANAPHGVLWCNGLVHNPGIDTSDQIIFLTNGHFPAPGESKSVAAVCAVPIAEDVTLIWLFYSKQTTVWDNKDIGSLWNSNHAPNCCDENVLFIETSLWKDDL